MPRTVKRYESRKLYDSQESRYVSLQEIAAWIRDGQEIEVIDNATDEVVTSQTLAQIILDEGRSGRSRLSPELLHDLVRASGEKISSGVTQVQKGLNRLVQASFDRLGPVKEAREEMSALRQRLDELETTLTSLEEGRAKKGTAKKVAKKAAKKSAEAPETKGENTEEA
jgi:polyhydroxyalkanoate synthesis repressor PhaR